MHRLPLPFIYHAESSSNQQEWELLFQRVRGWASLIDIRHPIEAKALAIVSIARRMTCSAWRLGNEIGWKKVFVETSSILFPMLELVGFARLGEGSSDQCLVAGSEWLLDTEIFPQVSLNPRGDDRELISLVPFMKDHSSGPRISNLIHLRNYYLHGLKNVRDTSVNIADIVNYEIPLAICQLAVSNIKIYWEQLRNDNGSHGWVDRLGQAEIQPFVIQGSNAFEQGLIDPEILDWLHFPDTECSDLYSKPRWFIS